MSKKRMLDLNIQEILQDWDANDAVRELIANAIDEQKISNSKEIEIYKENNNWIIRDYGRGLKEKDFIQNESKEKENHNFLIGKFGIGLKDAIAVLHRKKINIQIETNKFVGIPKMYKKNDSEEETIHMEIIDVLSSIEGTKIIIGINDGTIEKAKSKFLNFSNNEKIYTNEYGEILKVEKTKGVYFNGLIIAENKDLTFSYNLTTKNTALNKGLNRERKNVGKGAYSALMINIIKNVDNKEIAENISQAFYKNKEGEEFKDKEIRKMIYLHMMYDNVVFISETALKNIEAYQKDILNSWKIIIVKDIDKKMINEDKELIKFWWETKLRNYQEQINDNLEEIAFDDLDDVEKEGVEILHNIYDQLEEVPEFKLNFSKKNIVVLKELRDELGKKIAGLWKGDEKKLYISENVLNNERKSVPTFFHEVAHSMNDAIDLSNEFEKDLSFLGYIFGKHINI